MNRTLSHKACTGKVHKKDQQGYGGSSRDPRMHSGGERSLFQVSKAAGNLEPSTLSCPQTWLEKADLAITRVERAGPRIIYTIYLLAKTGPGYVSAMSIVVLQIMQLHLQSFEGSVIIYIFNSQSSCHQCVKATGKQFSDIKRLWKSTNERVI